MTRFTERVERDLGQIADRGNSIVNGLGGDPTTDRRAGHAPHQRTDHVGHHALSRQELTRIPQATLDDGRRPIAALALIGGLIFAGTRSDEDPVPADEPEPTVPAVDPEPEAGAATTYPTGASPFGVAVDGTSIRMVPGRP